MTKRKHFSSSIKCAGCKREFGIIQQAHIERCEELNQLGIFTRQQYKACFVANKIAKTLHPDMNKISGVNGAVALWKKPGQKERHAKRLYDLNSKGFMAQSPNKLESRFLVMIGNEHIEFSSFKFWKTIGTKHITSDFRVKNTKAVIEVFGDYWHRNDDSQERISMWKSVGYQCLVIWEHEINKAPLETVKRVHDFISQTLQECETPASTQDDDIV